MKRGLFIVFEGIDGCGKSTQVWRLGKHLSNLSKYNHIVMTREPGKDTKIRKMLRESEDPYSNAVELAKMYVEDRKEHIKELIMPELMKGAHVISDRYSLSTLAYQQTQGIPLKKLVEMHRGLPIPDIIFIVDIPAKVALERMQKDTTRDKKKEHKFEKDVKFIEKLRKIFLKLPEQLGNHNIFVIDGTKSVEDNFQNQIKPVFDKFYNSKYN